MSTGTAGRHGQAATSGSLALRDSDQADFGSSQAVARIRREYRRTGDIDLRNQLVVQYAPLVSYVAGRIGVGLPSQVEQGDLVSYGVFGLIDAIEKYDPDRAIKFETYAINRIRGAILDELRRIDWVPRSVREHARDVQRVIRALEIRLSRTPTEPEIAEELGVTPAELRSLLSQVSLVHVAALDAVLGDSQLGTGLTLGDSLRDNSPEAPGAALEDEEMKIVLAQAIHTLADQEKVVVALYHYEGLTLAEIGVVLDVTESRIGQVHTKAMMHLRSRLTAPS